MYIKKLKLINFRNYDDFVVNFDFDKTLIVGKNACGKTNLLEAVKYLTTLTKVKPGQDTDLIKHGCNFAKIIGEFSDKDNDFSAEILINPPKKKILKINGINKVKSSEYLENLCSVCFTAPDLLLLRGVPADRRSWLDEGIASVYPVYRDRLTKYNKARIQKSNCLKTFPINNDILDVWNDRLAIYGSNIVRLRLLYLKETEQIASLIHSKISKEEKLTISYSSNLSDELSGELSPEEILGTFKNTLEEKRTAEIESRRCLVGPHTDDIDFFINDIDAKKFASQGQQRTIVLSLKLAQTELLEKKKGTSPIILLDDVLAELDNVRQTFLLNAIEEKNQTMITSVDTLQFDKRYLENMEVLNLNDKHVTIS